MSEIHSTAVVDSGAKVAAGCVIGPYCVIGPDVVLGEGVQLHSHVVIVGRTTIGARTQIYPFSSIGHPPQDLKYKGEPSELRIGSDNVIREHVTMNPGTEGGGMVTEIGNSCLFMPGSHVAHDCRLGNLRDVDFDLERISSSEKARAIRTFVEGGNCACTFDCAILSSLAFSPLNLSKSLASRP